MNSIDSDILLRGNDRAKLKRHPSLFSRKSKAKTINGDTSTHLNGTDSSTTTTLDENPQS